VSFSKFGVKFTQESGILQLMDDLGEALASGDDWLMLGGGNPARIPAVEARFRARMNAMLTSAFELENLIGSYDSPKGNRALIEATALLLKEQFGWDIGPENVALTNGSQTSFFYLFNLLGGVSPEGEHRKILLPITPEYIGYGDAGIEENLFVSHRPEIERIGDDLFKYHVDFDALKLAPDIAAICVSRPTNPTSNVITEDELARLSVIAGEREIPLIIDNAYGTPFPNIMFMDAEPIWNDNIILTMSLSKLGLPGVRTGIVIAHEKIVAAVAALNAIVSLAPGSFGAALTRDMIRTGEVLRLSRDVIRPFYERKCAQALEWIREELDGLRYRVHKPEGTFFFWLWFEGLSIPSKELYRRLKQRRVLVVPGDYFFPGLDDDWPHRHECIRLNYSQKDETVRKGIAILAEELRAAG
jgi:valine--pyruvate aminotransferase